MKTRVERTAPQLNLVSIAMVSCCKSLSLTGIHLMFTFPKLVMMGRARGEMDGSRIFCPVSTFSEVRTRAKYPIR